MTTVKVSPKFQVVIPKEIREIANVQSGMRVEMIAYAGRIELIPVKSVKSLKGALNGIDTTIKREKDRI